MATSNKVSLGLIGAGRIGRLHAGNIRRRLRNVDLIAVADVDLAAAEELAAELDIPKVAADYRKIIEDRDIEAVVICSSTDTHARICQDAAALGKHIFCEKPIDLDLKRIDATLLAVKQADVKLQVGFNRRFDPNFRRVRQSVADGTIGVPHLLRITSRDPQPPPLDYIRVSGGIFLDMTIHDFDMARYLVGSEVRAVYAGGGVMVDPAIGQAGDIDTALVTLHFENGVLGAIDNSRQAVYGYDQRVEVFGSEGVIMVGNETPDRHTFLNRQGSHSALPLYFFLERYTESYAAEMEAFVECILNDTPPPVSGEDGRAPVAMGLAAGLSLRERRVVEISEVG
ncbi:MAG TPA: inositol 2-dehydrogenase [Anaerolineales bacterium]|nr:inositol 2-dehydrogenase [Anaerolineales bacterium]